MSSPLIISIEGNIGTGKSTLLANLKTHIKEKYHSPDKILFLEEPVDMWERFRDDEGKNILEKFYKDQRRYAFTFQVMAYISRLSLLKNAIEANPECEIIIIERSLCADKNIFMDMLHDDGIVENIEYNIYKEWYYQFIGEYRMNAVIYLDSNPETCYERIGRRGRDGEDVIPLEYLNKCRDYHSKWLVNTKCDDWYSLSKYADVYSINHEGETYPVLHIDTDAETDYSVDSIGYSWLESICLFIRHKSDHITESMIRDADFNALMSWRWTKRISEDKAELIRTRLKEMCPHTNCREDSNDFGLEGVVYYRLCDRCYSSWRL